MIDKAKYILLGIFLLISSIETYACEACGCALGGFNFGIIPQNEAHFIGIKYSQARFYAEMMHAGQFEYSNDQYQRLDIMGRIAIRERLQLNIVLPYLYNDMVGSHEKETLRGLGDPMMMLNYKVLDQKGNPMEAWLHNLWVGGGIKAPLADFEFSQTTQLINPNFQLGSGSWDFITMGNYTTMKNRWGLNIEGVYKINTANAIDYRFGNQYNLQGSIFYKPKAEKVLPIPMLGLYHESAGTHTFEGFYQVNSGGSATFAQAGVQVQFSKMMLHANYQLPISQSFNSDDHVHIESKGRFSVNMIAFIGKSNKKNVFSFD
ncbi:hypothetical protein ACFOUP_18660 [Belliella kenyensis]|uniref:Transporter n=1 Tax=Belliella kenyensis TaxID=1472724 RepID=A0ABV8ETS9_9BACT|nr:hypothetical protein [Belliella kenyensis]MCH7402201.1 hypothetical protein [Belliella kenyensis]MDN3601716.1 hypothetical protein [Belliella kenyensis]